jgi:hypothetical protein
MGFVMWENSVIRVKRDVMHFVSELRHQIVVMGFADQMTVICVLRIVIRLIDVSPIVEMVLWIWVKHVMMGHLMEKMDIVL